jgi:hypothetical protein
VTMPFPPRYRYRKYLKKNVLGTVPLLEDRSEKGRVERKSRMLTLS